MKRLSPIDPDHVESWVAAHLGGLFSGVARRSAAFVGGQTAADAALGALDIAGYAARRSMVDPPPARGASKLSPYIRHGLLDLPTVHDHPTVAGAASNDRFNYRKELLWQDYSRHWYAAFGTQTQRGVVRDPDVGDRAQRWERHPWSDDMNCVRSTLDELHSDGWMVNQTRMWLASQWTVRAGAPWREGEDEMFRHLLDGSRAANRQGWQWVVGGVRNRSYGFARRQVMKRAPAFCAECEVRDACPIVGYPESVSGAMIEPVPTMSLDLFGPLGEQSGLFDADDADRRVDAVWLTAESLGDRDPALTAHPNVPAHFVFDEPLLEQLALDGKRLVFLAECLSDLAQRRDLTVWRGRPGDLLAGRHADLDGLGWATTRAPVPGFARIVDRSSTRPVMEPWRWLRPPTTALVDRLQAKRFPIFRDWCRLTKPVAARDGGSS